MKPSFIHRLIILYHISQKVSNISEKANLVRLQCPQSGDGCKSYFLRALVMNNWGRTELERDIDTLVYDLYDLTSAEISLIEKEMKNE
jgi:hypothetical protein